MSAPPLLIATGLVRRFGRVAALGGVDLTVHAGELVLLLGSNGAGKTTLLRTIAGLVRPLRGSVLVDGRDVHRDGTTRALIGFVSHHPMVYDDLTPRENLRFHATLHGLNAAEREIEAALDAAGLLARADTPARGFSRGMLQRLSLARATLHAPRLLLFDEAHTGLDPAAAERLTDRIAAARAAGRAILAVSHDPAELWRHATRVVVLAAGRVIHDGPHPGDLDAFRAHLSGLHAA